MISVKIKNIDFEEKRELQDFKEIFEIVDSGAIILEISISNATLSNKQYHDLSKYIASSKNLRSLSINNSMENLDIKNLSEAIKTCVSLQDLNLEGSSITRRGCMYLTDAIMAHESLTSLNLSDNKFADEGISYFSNQIKTAPTKIELLKISGNNLGQESGESIANLISGGANFKKIYMQKNNLGDQGIAKIAEALHNNRNIESLDISMNNIGVLGAVDIAKMLKENKNLKNLYMHFNKTSDAGAKHIADSLIENKTLKHLELGHNGIGSTGAQYLNDAMKKNNTLLSINVENNDFSGKQFDSSSALNRSINVRRSKIKKMVDFIKELKIGFFDHNGNYVVRNFAEFIEYAKDLNSIVRNSLKVKELVHLNKSEKMLQQIMESRGEVSEMLSSEENWPEYYIEYGFEVLTENFISDTQTSILVDREKTINEIGNEKVDSFKENARKKAKSPEIKEEGSFFMSIIKIIFAPITAIYNLFK